MGLSGAGNEDPAVNCAMDLARRHGAALTGIAIVDPRRIESLLVPASLRVSPYGRLAAAGAIEEAQRCARGSLEAFESACATEALRSRPIQATGHLLPTLIAHGRYHDLLVLDLRGFFDHGGVHEPQGALFQLFTSGVRPIVAVTERPREVRRALVAYHGTPDAAGAMRRFVQLRLWPELELHLACFERTPAESEALLRDAAEYCREHGFDPQIHYDGGAARKNLLPMAASLNSDVIVLGSSPRSLLLRQILGDTLLTAIRSSDRPLFLSH